MPTLTGILNIFLAVLRGIPGSLQGSALALLACLTTIDIVYTIMLNMGEMDIIKYFIKKIIITGLLMWIIKDYAVLINQISDGFVKVANAGVGSISGKFINDPSALIDRAAQINIPIQKLRESCTGIREIGLYIYYSGILITIYAVFIFIAFQVILIWIEFYFITGFCIIFIPFGSIGVGQQYFQNAFKTIVACSLKVMVITAILGLSESILVGMALKTKPDDTSIMMLLSVAFLIGYLCFKIPTMASSMISGSPQMNSTDLPKLAAVAAAGASAAAIAGISAGVAGASSASESGASGLGSTVAGLKGGFGGMAKEAGHQLFGGGDKSLVGASGRGNEYGQQVGTTFGEAGSKKSNNEINSNNQNKNSETKTISTSENSKNEENKSNETSANTESNSKNNGSMSVNALNNSTGSDSNNSSGIFSPVTGNNSDNARRTSEDDKKFNNLYNGNSEKSIGETSNETNSHSDVQSDDANSSESYDGSNESGNYNATGGSYSENEISKTNSSIDGDTATRKTLLNGEEIKNEDK
ncbi:MAG: type IV secretion system protein [Fusobacteriaceae bacterium]|jgi:P-type conjugative transfer protein TrbL|nr:type IV secretion system protein [Fusobacteriaceae bacterium]